MSGRRDRRGRDALNAPAGGSTGRPSDQLWTRLFSDPNGVRAFPEARRIPLRLIDGNPDQPRAALAGIEELARHIKQYDLLQPVVVSGPQDGRYELIAGHRRLAAFQWLAEHEREGERWLDIPAIVRAGGTGERLLLAVSENVSRHQLSDGEVITAIRLLRDLHSWSQSEIARRMGVSRQWISQYFVAAGDAVLAEHIQTGRLSAAKAYEVGRARTAEARAAALAAALSGASMREIRRLADGSGQTASAPAEDDPLSSDWTAPGPGRRRAAGAPAEPSGLPAPTGGRAPLSERAATAPDVELNMLRTTELIRACLARGIKRVRAASLAGALEEDLKRLEAMIDTP